MTVMTLARVSATSAIASRIAGIAMSPSMSAHDDGIDAAEVAGEEPDREAEHDRERRDGQSDEERDARAVDGAGVDVAAEIVGAEPVHRRGRAQPLRRPHGERIAGDERRRDGEQRDQARITPPANMVGLRRMKRRKRGAPARRRVRPQPPHR